MVLMLIGCQKNYFYGDTFVVKSITKIESDKNKHKFEVWAKLVKHKEWGNTRDVFIRTNDVHQVGDTLKFIKR